jgi:DNA-binding transcriptional regulator PaaX
MSSRTNPDGSTTLQLTPNGAHRLLKEGVNRLTIHTPDKWDYRWRLISFKLPSSKDSERLFLYRRLKELNIHMVKRGLWIYPHDCFEVVQQIATYCNISRYMIYAEVLRFDGKTESELRRYYDLLK